jgi:hypothetical protein
MTKSYTKRDTHFYYTSSEIEPKEGSTTDIERCRLELGLKRYALTIYHTLPSGATTEEKVWELDRLNARVTITVGPEIRTNFKANTKAIMGKDNVNDSTD